MANYDSHLDIIAGDTHDLLDPVPPVYSNLTVRRAFIVWMHTGQQNKFKDVCNYYHKLEALEEAMSEAARASSRHHEFQLFSNRPQTSDYLRRNHQNLYPNNRMDPFYISKLESIKNDKCLFKHEGFNEYRQSGVPPKQIHETSKMIRHYCQTHLISPLQFLVEHKEYCDGCGIKPSVRNASSYIRMRTHEEELQLVENSPKTFSFLEPLETVHENESLDKNTLANNEDEIESKVLKIILDVDQEEYNGSGNTKVTAEVGNKTPTIKLDVEDEISKVQTGIEDEIPHKVVHKNEICKFKINVNDDINEDKITIDNEMSKDKIDINNDINKIKNAVVNDILKVNNDIKNDKPEVKIDMAVKQDTCGEFFNLFRNDKVINNPFSYLQQPLTFEDFAKVLNQNPSKFGSAENIRESKDIISFELNQFTYDSHLNMIEKVREI